MALPSAARPLAARLFAARPLAAAAALLLAGCAHHARVALEPPGPAAPPERPVLPPALAAVTPPPRDPQGDYRTINAGLTRDETVWHLRAALNVAAIGCRGAGDAATTPAYNAMLAAQKTALAAANEAVRARIRAGGGDADAYMTKLYNYFALPAAKPGFCAAAARLAPQAAAEAPAAFPAFAETALPALEAPFLAVYRQVDEYRLASAAWDARYGATTRLAAAGGEVAPPPVRADASVAALPAGDGAAGGHYDVPRVAASAHAHRGVAPRLAYEDIASVLTWQPARHDAYASR